MTFLPPHRLQFPCTGNRQMRHHFIKLDVTRWKAEAIKRISDFTSNNCHGSGVRTRLMRFCDTFGEHSNASDGASVVPCLHEHVSFSRLLLGILSSRGLPDGYNRFIVYQCWKIISESAKYISDMRENLEHFGTESKDHQNFSVCK
jgi:hypothetical protein